jgi:hypothetical protein
MAKTPLAVAQLPLDRSIEPSVHYFCCPNLLAKLLADSSCPNNAEHGILAQIREKNASTG